MNVQTHSCLELPLEYIQDLQDIQAFDKSGFAMTFF